MSGQFSVTRQPLSGRAGKTATKRSRATLGQWHNPLPLAIPSVMAEAERIPSTDTALRADDLHLCVTDRPRSPVNGELLPAGGSNSRPLRTQVIRSLGGDSHLELNILLQMEIGAMVAADNLASPNQSPRRRAVVHSAGKDVQRHVISETVPGSYLPMRQVADAGQATYETVEVDSLPNRPLTLSDLRLELGIVVRVERKPFAVQMESAFHALEMLDAIERIESAVVDIQSAIAAPLPPTPTYWQLRHIQLAAKWPFGAMRQQAVKTRCGGIVPVVS